MQVAQPQTLTDSSLLPRRQGTYAHPVEEIEATHAARRLKLENYALQNVYGSHMPMRLEMERTLLSRFQRLPVLKSEMAGLETVTKRDLEMEFADSFGPFGAPEVSMELHEITEKKLKL